jgi:hypothetical protein
VYVHVTPSSTNVADMRDDGCETCKLILPVLSSGPSWVQMPTCRIVSGPE